MTALHIFDMDGTLLRGTTASLEIARQLGCIDDLLELEGQFARGEVTALGFGEAIARLWKELDDDTVGLVADAAPWITGIDEVWADITARGERSMLITMSPDFFATRLLGRGVDQVHASRFPGLPFSDTNLGISPLLPAHKVEHVETERRRLGLECTRCVAYGDSMSDAPLFRAIPHSVAVNADEALERSAAVAYQGDDLREAYEQGRALLDDAR